MCPSKKVTEAESFTKMQEFAPKNTSPPPSEHWPTAEELAAYIDGTLDRAVSERITEHLASCEECYSVYSETLLFQLESEPESEVENLVRFPSRRRSSNPWWFAAAALLVLGIGFGWYLFQKALWGPAPNLMVANVLPEVKGQPVRDLLWQHATFRGGQAVPEEHAEEIVDPETDVDRKSFEVGALLVNFELSSQAGDARNASETWKLIGNVVGTVLLMKKEGDGIVAESLDIETGKLPLRTATAKATTKEKEWREPDSSLLEAYYLDLGKWTNAGHVAAKIKDRSFFRSPTNHRFLAYSLRNTEMALEPEVRQRLQEIARLWVPRDLGAKEFAALEQHFQAILDHYDFTS
jgi:putative zinc finger protein